MDLRDRCARARRRIEGVVDLRELFAEGSFDLRDRDFGRERRHLVLELRKLVGDVRWQKIPAGREQLPELDEDRAEPFERAAQAYAAGRAVPAEDVGAARKGEPASARLGGEQELVQAEAERDLEDRREAAEAEHAGRVVVLGSRDYRPAATVVPGRRGRSDGKPRELPIVHAREEELRRDRADQA